MGDFRPPLPPGKPSAPVLGLPAFLVQLVRPRCGSRFHGKPAFRRNLPPVPPGKHQTRQRDASRAGSASPPPKARFRGSFPPNGPRGLESDPLRSRSGFLGKGMSPRGCRSPGSRVAPARAGGCPWPRLRRGEPKADSGFTTGGVMESPPSSPDSATHRSKGDDGWLRRGRKATACPFQVFEDRNRGPRGTAGGSLRGPPRRSRCPRW